MIIEQMAGYDYYLKYYNSDGNESSMCGNGGRCSAAFAYRVGIISENTRFFAADGPHEAEILSSGPGGCEVRLKMKDTRVGKEFSDGYFIDTGSPHFVKFVDSPETLNVTEEGRMLRFDQRFAPGGTNVNFVEKDNGRIKVRTYERGVENETLSCGTGVTASALVLASLPPRDNKPVTIHTKGGSLTVYFSRQGDDFINVYLEGPASFVFTGEISLDRG
jgi:diaminopimelate epimerase